MCQEPSTPRNKKRKGPMKKPTKKQKIRFWKWCGFRLQGREDSVHYWLSPTVDGEEYPLPELPPIDLNNLWYYAVPEAISVLIGKGEAYGLNWRHAYSRLFLIWQKYFEEGVDVVDTLFWALWEVLKEEKERC